MNARKLWSGTVPLLAAATAATLLIGSQIGLAAKRRIALVAEDAGGHAEAATSQAGAR